MLGVRWHRGSEARTEGASQVNPEFRKRRAAAKWTYDNEFADATRRRYTSAEIWSGTVGQCAMVTSTGVRCVKTAMHRRGHSTQEKDVGKQW